MARFTITIDCVSAAELAAVAAYLARMPDAAPPRAREPGDDDDDPAPPPKPGSGHQAPPIAATATELMDWINSQRDRDDARRRVQTAGKKLGFGWRFQQFKPDQVAAVVHAMREHANRGQMGAKT